MKSIGFLTLCGFICSFFCVSAFAGQTGGYPVNYDTILQKDVNTLELMQENKSMVKSMATAGTGSIASLMISSIDATAFPEINAYLDIKDADANFLKGLAPSDITVLVHHPLDSEPVGKKLSSYTLNELGDVSTGADIVFVIDSTGSMSGQIGTVKNNVLNFVDQLVANNVKYRLAGFDYGDEVPYRSYQPFTDSADTFKSWVSTLYAHGGDDTPENPLDSLIAAGGLPFRDSAQKIIVLITDAPPHVAGDGGDSATTATFSAAAGAMSGKTFYYFSDVTDYNALGPRLGGTNFDADTLIGQLSDSVTQKYLLTFTDPAGTKDGLVRTLYVSSATNEGIRDNGQYKPEPATVDITGTVTNTDSPPSPLNAVSVVAVNKATKEEYHGTTNSNGKYSLHVVEGTYSVSASKTEYADKVQDISVAKTKDDTPVTLDFSLSRATIQAEKDQLIKLAQKIGGFKTPTYAPFAEDSTAIVSWAESLPTIADGDANDPTDAQKEALKRLIQSSIVLDTTNQDALSDAQNLGSSVAGVISSVLELTGTLDRIQESIQSVVKNLPASDGWFKGWAYKKLKQVFEFTATKIGELRISIANTILDFVNMALSSYPTATKIITYIKDVIDASSGKPLLVNTISSQVAPWVATQFVIPFYSDSLKTKWSSNLTSSESITAANFDAMRTAIDDSITKLNAINDAFRTLKDQLATAGSVSNLIASIKNALDVIHNLDAVIKIAEEIPVTAPYADAIDTTLAILDKVLAGLNLEVSATTAGLTGYHLYGLSDSAEGAMDAAYGGLSSAEFFSAYSPGAQSGAWQSYIAAKDKNENRVFTAATGMNPLQDFKDGIGNAITYLDSNSLDAFVDNFTGGVLNSGLDELRQEFNVMKMKVQAGNASSSKPINYDLLSEAALTAHLNFSVSSLSYTTKISSLLITALYYADADGNFGSDAKSIAIKENLKQLLYNWRDEAQQTSDTIAAAVNAVSSYITATALVTVDSLTADIDKIDGTASSITITAKLTNHSTTASSSDIALTLALPKASATAASALITALASGSGTSISPIFDAVSDATATIPSLGPGESKSTSWTINIIDDPLKIDKEQYNFMLSCSAGSGTVVTAQYLLSIKGVPKDTDGDGMPDYWENEYGLSPSDPSDAREDKDGDLLSNIEEYRFGFDPTKVDSDGDGISDAIEYLRSIGINGVMAGDVDHSSAIEQADFDKVANSWGAKLGDAGYLTDGDMNKNGQINVSDILRVHAFIGAR